MTTEQLGTDVMRENTAATPRVFIDGEAGTVGLGIRERLAPLSGLEILSIDPDKRKDTRARQELVRNADIVILCLPDPAAIDMVAFIDSLGNRGPRVIDGSTAHRVAGGWVYGFPEMAPGQADAIRNARRVANPGCYPTGALAILRPLVDAGVVPRDFPITINAVSGYSGGGRTLIDAFENGMAPAFKLYALTLSHKHLPELQHYSGLSRAPIFVPSVGAYRQGMLVSIPLHLDLLPDKVTGRDIHRLLVDRYRDDDLISVVPVDIDAGPLELEPEGLNGTDRVELRVYDHVRGHAVVVARLDNLGKGAAGAAVQCMKLMLGID